MTGLNLRLVGNDGFSFDDLEPFRLSYRSARFHSAPSKGCFGVTSGRLAVQKSYRLCEKSD